MKEVDCHVVEEKLINDKSYFVVISLQDNYEYIIPKNQLIDFDVKIGEVRTFYKEFKKKENRHFLYLKKEIIDFKIVSFDKDVLINDRIVSKFCVSHKNGNEIKVAAFAWQKVDAWKYDHLKCEILKYDSNNQPVLVNRDYRHPYYNVNETYSFKIIGSKKRLVANKEYNIYELLGEDDCKYEVNMLTGQQFIFDKNEEIKCKVTEISHILYLSQVDTKDPFFVTVDKIILNTQHCKKYFNPIFQDGFANDIVTEKIKEQYTTKSAFWVFTFANKVLPLKLREAIAKENYKDAKEVNSLVIVLEKWIISKGIIKSIPNESLRASTINKAKNKLDSALIVDEVLESLMENKYGILAFVKNLDKGQNGLEYFYHVISLSNIIFLDEKVVLEILQETIKLNPIKEKVNQFFFGWLLNKIASKKNVFIDKKAEEYFSLTTANDKSNIAEKENNRKFIYYTYCELMISMHLGEIEKSNILIGQLLKRWNSSVTELDKKYRLLLNSYSYFDNYMNTSLKNPFYYDGDLTLNFDKLIHVNHFEQTQNEHWDQVEESFNSGAFLKVQLSRRSKAGYEVKYHNIKGFMPSQHLEDTFLKKYPFEKCDFVANVKCISFSKLFKFFIVKQLPRSDENYYFSNNNIIKIGQIYEGVIQTITDYGCFISTEFGEGLLRVNNIFNFYWDFRDIYSFFKKNDVIKVLADCFDEKGKVEFNFCKMEDIDPNCYTALVDKVYSDSLHSEIRLDDEFETDVLKESFFDITQYEKALCFEQNALLQKDINEKLHSFRLAKQFYANTKDARSYLINIYSAYFEVLLKIQGCIQNKSLSDIVTIRLNAVAIKAKINAKTIETFPDSEKLIYFLDIISLFNKTGDESLELLYRYIRHQENSKRGSPLKTIAKITMANNLIVFASQDNQESSQDNQEFCLRNLRLIFNYISDGILTLSETVEDKYERELREDILYWSEKIKGDESETLEFKSSFFTPIIDERHRLLLEELKSNPKQTDDIKKSIDKINGELAKKRVIHSALKTLSAFTNTSGGTLLLGVNDSKEIIGLEQEYLTFKKKDQNRDGFGKFFDDTVKTYLGDSFSSLINRKFVKFPKGDILIVTVKPSMSEVFLLKDDEGKDSEQLFIRNLSSSRALWGIELAKFIKAKSIEGLKNNILRE